MRHERLVVGVDGYFVGGFSILRGGRCVCVCILV